MKSILILAIALFSCNLSAFDTKKSGIHKNSQSIEESKEKKVFRFQLTPNKYIMNVGNGKTDTIKQIWVEYSWMYENNGNIKTDSTSQVLILFGNSSRISDDRLLLEYKEGYLGWNGVFFGSYSDDQNRFIATFKRDSIRVNIDTIYYTK
jgi:hypothetical protein